MFEKLVPDARFDRLDIKRALLASAETVTIQPWQAQVIHTGLYTHEPLILSFQMDNGKMDMFVLMTTALTAEREVKVAVLNRGTDSVTLVPGEMFLVAHRLYTPKPIDASA